VFIWVLSTQPLLQSSGVTAQSADVVLYERLGGGVARGGRCARVPVTAASGAGEARLRIWRVAGGMFGKFGDTGVQSGEG
jgi:hypothetical protein